MLGCDGCFAGGANVFPDLFINLYKAAKNRDVELSRELQGIVMEINKTIYSIGHYHSSYLKGLKCASNLMGILKDDYMAPPFHKFMAPERTRVEVSLTKILKKREKWIEKN